MRRLFPRRPLATPTPSSWARPRTPGRTSPRRRSPREAGAGLRVEPAGAARPYAGAALGPHQGTPVREVGHDSDARLSPPLRLLLDPAPLRAGDVRYRPLDEVVREVATSPTRAVVFWDDNIGANPRYAKELFRALTPLGKWWTSQCTANAARDEELVELAARSGCKALFLGLRSEERRVGAGC